MNDAGVTYPVCLLPDKTNLHACQNITSFGSRRPFDSWKRDIYKLKSRVQTVQQHVTYELRLGYVGHVTSVWPKKASHYRESSLNCINDRQPG